MPVGCSQCLAQGRCRVIVCSKFSLTSGDLSMLTAMVRQRLKKIPKHANLRAPLGADYVGTLWALKEGKKFLILLANLEDEVASDNQVGKIMNNPLWDGGIHSIISSAA